MDIKFLTKQNKTTNEIEYFKKKVPEVSKRTPSIFAL